MKFLKINEWHSGKTVFKEHDDIHGTGRRLAEEFLTEYRRVPNDPAGVLRHSTEQKPALKVYHGAKLMLVSDLKRLGFIR